VKLSLITPTTTVRLRIVCFSIAIVDVSTSCRSKSSINFTEFIWEYMCEFGFKMHVIICVLLDRPRVLHVNHHRAASDVGIQIAYAMCVRRTFDLRYNHSWATVPPTARETVMCAYGSRRRSEV